MDYNSKQYLKNYRKRRGISLKDMAYIIGMDSGNLSKVETGKLDTSLKIVISYHQILNIPIRSLCKQAFSMLVSDCLRNSISLESTIVEEEKEGGTNAKIESRKESIALIIDRLVEQQCKYESE